MLPTALPALLSTTLSPAFSVYLLECGAAGSASAWTACAVHPTLRQSRSRHSHASPLHPSCPSPPLLPVWMNVYFLFPWCWTSLPFDFLSVLVVRGGAVCLPTPPSWLEVNFPVFNLRSCCCSGIPPRIPHHILLSCLLRHLDYNCFSNFPPFQ